MLSLHEIEFATVVPECIQEIDAQNRVNLMAYEQQINKTIRLTENNIPIFCKYIIQNRIKDITLGPQMSTDLAELLTPFHHCMDSSKNMSGYSIIVQDLEISQAQKIHNHFAELKHCGAIEGKLSIEYQFSPDNDAILNTLTVEYYCTGENYDTELDNVG